MGIDKVGGDTPFHGRIENKKNQEDTTLAKAVLSRRAAPNKLTFTAEPGAAHSLTQSIASVIFRRNG